MATINLKQDIFSYAGSVGAADPNDIYVVTASRSVTPTTPPFLSGTYFIDTNGSGNDTLVFKISDVFKSDTNLFIPQFDLANNSTPTWYTLDQRGNPLKIEWSTFNSGDKVQLQIYETVAGTERLATTITNTGIFISNDGTALNGNGRSGGLYSKESYIDEPGFENKFNDADRRFLGTFYATDASILASSASSTPYNGMYLMSDTNSDNRSDSNHSFEQYIFNEVYANRDAFSSASSPVQQLEADIVIDRDALNSGRRYLDLAGSIGIADSNSDNSNFTSIVEDVQYRVNIDMSAAAGVTIKETNTGLRDWSDEVKYTDIGITSSGRSGIVNFGAPNSSSGVTLTTGNFNSEGIAASKLRVESSDAGWIRLSSLSGLSVGDKVLYQTQGDTTGQLNSGNHYVIQSIDSANNKIRIAYENAPANEYITPSGSFFSDSTFQKLSGYDVTVERSGATDVFSGFKNFTLSTNADTINYGGGEFTSVAAGSGNDTWNIATLDQQNTGWTQLKIETENWNSNITGASSAVTVNLSGSNKSVVKTDGTTVTLESRFVTSTGGDTLYKGSMLDEFGSTDVLNINSGSSYSDDLHLTLLGTSFGDRYYLSADGLGAISEYRIEASSGFDQYFMNSTVRSLTNQPGVISTNLPILQGTNPGYAQIEEYSRFFGHGDYKVSFSNVTVGSTTSLVASLKQTASISSLNASGQISVEDADHWKVGETIIYRAGANDVTGLVDGTSYKISEVQTNDASGASRALIKLTTVSGGAVALTAADSTTSGSTFERLASTGTVDSNYVTFKDDAGNFSRLALKVDGKISADTTMSFTAHANVPEITYDSYIWSDSLADNANRADFSIDYRNLYDTAPITAEKVGIQYINGIVHKGALGFDRFVDYADAPYVGTRSYSMTEYDDVIIQNTGSHADVLKLTAGLGQDKIFVDAFNSDANDLIQIHLGEQEWSDYSDGNTDQVEIGLSRLSKAYGNVQYIDISEADSFDSIKFVDAEGFTVVQQNRFVSANSYLNFVTYNIYQGSENADNLVLSVRVSKDKDSWTNQSYDAYAGYTNWGTTSADGRSISGNSVPVAMTANNDAALLFEDSALSLTPYLMGAGNDYIVSMGGDQDIGLGAGDDFISVRNYGQQLFVSGGAGNDTIGLSGNYSYLSNGTVVSDQWNFSSIDVSKAQDFLSAKYPTVTADKFEWATGPLDRVMQATNRLDGTTIYFQAEQLSFSNGSINSEAFLPPIVETYDTTSRSLASTTLFGRSTNDTINLKVSDVDYALKHIGSWLDSTTTPSLTTGSTLVGSHTLEIKAQDKVKWFTGESSTYTNGGFKLVDIENIRLFDNSNNEVTIRVAGSSGYSSVYEAVQSANRGDVIFIAETREGLQTGTTRAAVNMDTTVDIDSGLRVAFEELRSTPTIPQLTVNMTSAVKTSDSTKFFGTNTHALEVLGTANVNINGSNVSDLIIGNKGNNVISGQAGNDIIFGGNGSDIIIGGSGNDTLIGGSSHRAVAIQHTAQDGTFEGFNLTTDTFRISNTSELEFKTGDKIIYQASGGTGIQANIGGTLTTLSATTSLYVIRNDLADGTSLLKLASTEANARNGTYLDIVSNGTATNHSATLDNVTYSATNLPGSDYLYGGSGNDTLIATGVMGSLDAKVVAKDTLTMNGGSGNDTFALFGNSGQINMFGGSGADKVEVYDNFMDVAGPNKGARMVDFAAAQDDLLAAIDTANLGSMSIETKLNNGGLTLSQLVSPPLPVVNGSAENGNFQQINNDKVIGNYALEIDNYQLNVADLVNQHNAHAA